jgi:hypothetical protein
VLIQKRPTLARWVEVPDPVEEVKPVIDTAYSPQSKFDADNRPEFAVDDIEIEKPTTRRRRRTRKVKEVEDMGAQPNGPAKPAAPFPPAPVNPDNGDSG